MPHSTRQASLTSIPVDAQERNHDTGIRVAWQGVVRRCQIQGRGFQWPSTQSPKTLKTLNPKP